MMQLAENISVAEADLKYLCDAEANNGQGQHLLCAVATVSATLLVCSMA
jgi:hypothetical protein